MVKKILELMKKYEEIISYLIVGVLTTIVAWGAMFLWNWLVFGNPEYPTQVQNLVLSTVNWVAGVIFAYFTNRRFVFKSHGKMGTEAVKFVASRLSTYVMDVVLRQVFGLMNMDVYLSTFIIAVIVTVANYIFSKLFVFKRKES